MAYKFITLDGNELFQTLYSNSLKRQKVHNFFYEILSLYKKLPNDDYYIAGGSALYLLAAYREVKKDTCPFHRVNDIDCFFPFQQVYTTVSNKLLADKHFNESYLIYDSKFAKTFCPRSNSEQVFNSFRLQLINFRFDPIEDILSSFDLYNSMCAYNVRTKQFIFHEDLPDLIDSKTLRVNVIKQPLTITRITKYLTSKNLCHIEESSKQLIYEAAEKFYVASVEVDDKVLRKSLQDRLSIFLRSNYRKIDPKSILQYAPIFHDMPNVGYGTVTDSFVFDLFLKAVKRKDVEESVVVEQ